MRKIKKIVDLSWEFTAEIPYTREIRNRLLQLLLHWKNEGYNLSTLVGNTDRYSCRCAVSFFKQR